jgi:protein tyrosine phosphatase (PTP) superfamily phosphohydrolase (DUF442 family)
MIRQVLWAGVLGAASVSTAGCCHKCCRPVNDRPPPSGRYIGDPVAPPAGAYIPPPPGGLPAPALPDSSRSNRFDPNYPPPEILLPDSPAAKARGVGPDLTYPPNQSAKILGDPVRAAGYGEPVKKSAPGAGVPGFAVVKDGVATGRRPTLDGWDALKTAGYKTAVYLHDPATDTTSAKEQAEKRGLTFVAVPVSAEKFEDAMGRFQTQVTDKSTRPMYVFDHDGVRTGSLWYAYLRTVDFLGSDEARVKAAAFGLKDPPSAEQQTFWVAVQKYLASR